MPWEFQHQAMPAFHDQSWKRDEMAAWDEVWAAVSVPARAAFLGLPLPARARQDPPEVILTGPARDELRAAGLAEAVDPKRVSIAAKSVGFAKRLRALRECRLLDPAGGELREYVRAAFDRPAQTSSHGSISARFHPWSWKAGIAGC